MVTATPSSLTIAAQGGRLKSRSLQQLLAKKLLQPIREGSVLRHRFANARRHACLCP